MGLTPTGWTNKNGTAFRNCSCGTWKAHWIKHAQKSWPGICSVEGCNSPATLGAHVYNSEVDGERIVPMCDSCNKRSTPFTLKGNVTLPRANTAMTCA